MRNQRGVALLVAIIVAILLSLLGLSLTFMSLKEAGTATEFENHERALMVADGGLQAIKRTLRGNDLTDLLNVSVAVPYSSSGRMPILPVDARNIDFDNPTGSGATLVRGMLTPPDGEFITVGDVRGRYFAKVSDNLDEAAAGMPNDPLADADATIYVRVVGVYRGTPGEITTKGTSVKNSVAVIEAMLKRDMSFDLQSPLSFYGHNVDSNFAGNSFKIDGYDHRGMTYNQITGGHSEQGLDAFYGISCLYDDAGGGDATTAVTDIKSTLKKNQNNNIIGEGGTPSITDGTNDVRNSDNEDATNIFDADFLANFVRLVSSVADVKFTSDAHLSGSSAVLGTDAKRQITVAEGDLELTGGGSGAGILIVKGNFKVGGAFTYDGVILVVGEGTVDLGGTNKSFVGGMYVANLEQNATGTGYTFGTPAIDDSGNSNFYMKSDSIKLAYALLPMRLLSWREITPEIEP